GARGSSCSVSVSGSCNRTLLIEHGACRLLGGAPLRTLGNAVGSERDSVLKRSLFELEQINVGTGRPDSLEVHRLQSTQAGDHRLESRQLLTCRVGQAGAQKIVVRLASPEFLAHPLYRVLASGRGSLILDSLVVCGGGIENLLRISVVQAFGNHIPPTLVKSQLSGRGGLFPLLKLRFRNAHFWEEQPFRFKKQ